ncbi:TonB-dependent receptor plug domain-containing protein [Sphingomonas sp. IC4-52]|uniref:TonB-dependent receptor plug domain-containing protein n=1 Tax=Sphingomonas sp. IC4-52 TaxID=2887202 RepID=UPI001D0F4DA2|nr:TonB-dependent receptor [Sphingomonas sp. IC4-52]MCC2981496.1 TonB-dependent receptor [Sphingomonas sp. IC4-52]
MKTIYWLAASATLIAAPALAQEGAQDASPRGDIVVTASGVPQDVDTTGQAVTIIDRDTIEQRQTVVLSDLLQTTPGVTVTRNGGVGTVNYVRIRGAEADQTLTLIDGVRVNDPSSPGGAFDFANLLSASVERVEVVRGPNSVPWGSQAIGGVVNVITQAPTQQLRARGNVEYGAMDTLFASGGISGGSGIVSGSLTGGYLRTDGISAYDRGTERDGYRQYGASGRVEVAFAPNIRLDLRGYWADSRTDLDGFPAPTFAFADTREYSTAQELYGYAGLNADFLDGRFRNLLAFQIADIDRDNYDPDLSAAPQFLSRGRSERYTYKGDLQATDEIRVVLGAEHETTRLADGTDRFSRGTTSFWGEVILTPVAGLAITGGVRHDDDDAFGGRTTFAANAAYTLPTGTTLRASYAEGFKAPTLYQLYAPFYGTPTLDAETARSWDAGVEQRLIDDRLVASATYFTRHTRNQIDFDALTFTYSNIARTKAEGVEIGLLMRPVDRFTINASYSHIDSENRSAGFVGNDLARRPEDSVSVSADYRFPFGLALGATVLTVGDSFDDAANRVRLDGYTLTNLRAELPLNDRLSIYGRVENVFDADYRVVANYGTIGRAAYGGLRVKLD